MSKPDYLKAVRCKVGYDCKHFHPPHFCVSPGILDHDEEGRCENFEADMEYRRKTLHEEHGLRR